jgi:hypothetical protein
MSTWAIPSSTEWAVPGFTEDWELGSGVSGRVVEAINTATGQHVAIKYLNDTLVRDPEFLSDFRATTERLTSLDAPHLATVFDYVEQPGTGAAIVTELIDGISLRKMLHRGPLGTAAALVVFKDSLLGLAAAHSRRVAHRDVKPDNVLIDANGWCTLTDVGLAVKTDKQMPAAGTPEYMAPELWNGSPYLPATDIYAATIMLCESLAGKPPYTGKPEALREGHELTQAPLDPYDPPLRDLIGWGLAKYSDRRPSSARAFAGAVDDRAVAAYGPNWEAEGRAELAERADKLLAVPDAGGGRSVLMARLARRRMMMFASIAAVAVVALLVGGLFYIVKQPVKVKQVSNVSAANVDAAIAVSPPLVTSKCLSPTTFTFTGTITAAQAGTVVYQWVYSSGPPGPVQSLQFNGVGGQPVSSGAFTTSTGGNGWAQLKLLLNPAPKLSSKATYSLICTVSNNNDISMTAKVAPAALSMGACQVPFPTLTATGSITAKNAGPVSYYWAISNGTSYYPVPNATNAGPITINFAQPGTQTVKPMTFPTLVPSSGGVVLVVTKPVPAVSAASQFRVTCPGAANPPPAAAPTVVKTTAKPSASASKSASPSVSPTPTTPSATPTSPSATPTSPTATPTSPTATPTTSSATATGTATTG